ncbi:c-type cytochrome [Zhongshania aliphaticivorans]|uniref:c-type cytochrome n=1 Tax=Zhongshania aliphaticivorans TaxID=1470434 RepID=UPI0012E47AB9|nr:c-type cytochrome [Zhongshania aliphaticivorans]CAA0111470.1 Cytochrome c5 [Zhongshania aliphaticivorans]
MRFQYRILNILLSTTILLGLSACGPSPDPSSKAGNGASQSVASTPRSRMPSDSALKSLYIQSCYGCHSSGAAGAPRSGNIADWAPRLQKGMDVLLHNTIHGINSMPPKGMCIACSDEEFTQLILFLSGQRE